MNCNFVYRWGPLDAPGKVEMDPDRRVQNSIGLVFTKAGELGSARQVLLWFRHEKVDLPSLVLDSAGADIEWKLPVYNTIWHMLRNPMYAGAYAFGKTEARTRVIGGRARKSEEESNGYVALPPSLQSEFESWLAASPDEDPRAFIFSSRNGTPLDGHNYLRRFLQPTAARLGVPEVTFQSLRRTFATLIQNSGTVKDAQTQLRHADAQTTMNIYQKSIPASVSSAVEAPEKKIEAARCEADHHGALAPEKAVEATESSTPTKGQVRRLGKSRTPNAQLLHNFSQGGFSTVSGSAWNSWKALHPCLGLRERSGRRPFVSGVD